MLKFTYDHVVLLEFFSKTYHIFGTEGYKLNF